MHKLNSIRHWLKIGERQIETQKGSNSNWRNDRNKIFNIYFSIKIISNFNIVKKICLHPFKSTSIIFQIHEYKNILKICNLKS